MDKSQEIGDLITALSRAQGEFPVVPFNAVNPFLKNHYADLGSVIETAKEILSNHGLSVTQLVNNDGLNIGVTTLLAHSSGQWISDTIRLPLADEKGQSLAQTAGKNITYLRRYAYGAILGLYTGEDDDGNEPKRETKTEQKKPAAQPATKPIEKKVEPPAHNPEPAVTQPASVAGNGHKPEPPEQDATLITVWDGKTQKPPKEVLSDKASEAFKKLFSANDLLKVPVHLTNHLKSHFGVAKISDLSYEKATALARHLREEGDDPRWYSGEPKKESPVATKAESGAEPVTVPDVGVDLNMLAKVWRGDEAMFTTLPANEQERITDMLALVKSGALEKGDYAGMVGVLDA